MAQDCKNKTKQQYEIRSINCNGKQNLNHRFSARKSRFQTKFSSSLLLLLQIK